MSFFIFICTSNFWYSSLNFQNCSYVTTLNWVLNAHKKGKLFFHNFLLLAIYLHYYIHTWQSKCFFLLSIQSKFCGKPCSTYEIQAFPHSMLRQIFDIKSKFRPKTPTASKVIPYGPRITIVWNPTNSAFRGRWGRRGQTTSKPKTTKILNQNSLKIDEIQNLASVTSKMTSW